MKISISYLVAGLIIVLIVIWFAIGGLDSKAEHADTTDKTVPETTIPSVEITQIHAENHENFLALHGQSEADREVQIKAQTAGLVIRTPVKEGSMVGAGTLLCQQEINARQAQLDQARASLRSRELEHQASEKLVQKGFRSTNQNATTLAALDSARAAVKQAEIELNNVNITAPFRGVFDQQIAEVGDYLAPGQACGLLVDLDPLVVAGQVTENNIGKIRVGLPAKVELVTGEKLDGKVRFIEASANPATRTFRIEVAVPNGDAKLKAGITANIQLLAGSTNAHYIPASVLTLSDNGVIGARYIDDANTVHFAPVQTIDEDVDGIWVSGLPDPVNLIIKGQDYVREGITVKTQYDLENSDGANAASSPDGGR